MNLTRDAPHRGHLRGNTVFTTSRWQVKHCQVVEVSAARVRSAPVLSVIQQESDQFTPANEFSLDLESAANEFFLAVESAAHEFFLAVESAANEFFLAVERLRPFSPGLLALDLAGLPPTSVGAPPASAAADVSSGRSDI